MGSRSVATVEPATVQLAVSPSARECEAEHLAAAVAHEDCGRSAEPEVVRQEAEAGEADAEGEEGDEAVRVHGVGVDGEERTGDRRERRREPVHVVQQVEGVRHPDQPDEAQRGGRDVVRDDLDADARGEHDHRRRDLRCDLRHRREAVDVVEQPGDEEDRAAGEDASELTAGRDQPRGEGHADGREQTRHDPAAAEQGCRPLVPAVGPGRRDDDAGSRGAQQRPDGQQAGGESGERGRGDRHGAARLRRAVRAARTTEVSLTKGC